jgi:hypothetical protein
MFQGSHTLEEDVRSLFFQLHPTYTACESRFSGASNLKLFAKVVVQESLPNRPNTHTISKE